MVIELIGIVDKIGKIEPMKKGFRQTVILEQPERKDEFDRVIVKAQFFPVSIFSNQQADSRFLGSKHIRATKKAKVYLHGSRWFNNHDFNYNVQLNLDQWLS